jgi:hypothetical protein
LMNLRIIKWFTWAINGRVDPMAIIKRGEEVEDLEHELKLVKKWKNKRVEIGSLDKNAKEANREIAKWEFYYDMQSKPD